MVRFLTPALAGVLALAAGCVNFPSIAPGTPGPQVQSKYGAPGTVWKNPDGSEVWEYPLGPLGVETFMITVGPDGKVREVKQVLSPEYLDKVQPGMSRDEVRRLIGKPREIVIWPERDEETWTWRIQEFHFRYRHFHALFDRNTGILRRTLIIDEERDRGDKRGVVEGSTSASFLPARPSPRAQA